MCLVVFVGCVTLLTCRKICQETLFFYAALTYTEGSLVDIRMELLSRELTVVLLNAHNTGHTQRTNWSNMEIVGLCWSPDEAVCVFFYSPSLACPEFSFWHEIVQSFLISVFPNSVEIYAMMCKKTSVIIAHFFIFITWTNKPPMCPMVGDTDNAVYLFTNVSMHHKFNPRIWYAYACIHSYFKAVLIFIK